MTQQEKLELAKDGHGTPDATEEERAHLEAIFAELKESEDVRIRKSLIGYLKECRNNTRSEVMIGEYAKWISWLEKQGEQKSANKEYLLTFADLTRTFPPETEWSYSDAMPSYIVGFNKKREILIFIEDGDKISPNGKFLVTIYRSKTGIHDTQKQMFEGVIDFKEKHQDFNKHIQDGDEIVTNENGERVNISQLNRVAKPRGWISWVEKQGNSSPTEDELEALRIAAYEPTKNWCEKLQNLYEKLARCEQGEQPNKVSIWKHWNNGIAGNGGGKLIYLIKNGNDYSLSSILEHECDYVLLSDLDKLMLEEKQGEQKLVNNVDPKFNIGDWVIHKETGTIHQIQQCVEFFNGHAYGYDLTDGRHISIFKTDEYRLWTVQDAKAGDALVNGSNIFIFHCIDTTRLMGYCHVNTDDGRFYDDIGKNECFCLIDAVVIPASKEQRELLFSKMKEAGYEWDAEKKVLKKLEQDQSKPKFKDEDWIVGDNTHDVYKVLCAVDGEYALSRNIDSNVVYAKTETIDKKYHLWSIGDAKDGDVLVFDDAFILIFKKKGDPYILFPTKKTRGFHFKSHVFLDFLMNVFEQGSFCDDRGNKCHPATKEQRIALFAMMKEYGYEWDSEKKMLTKIEQKPVDNQFTCLRERMEGE